MGSNHASGVEMRCHSSAPRAHTQGGRNDHIPHHSHHLPLANARSARTSTHTASPSMCTSRTSRQQAPPPAPPRNLGRKAAAGNVRPYAHNSHESPGQRTQHKTVNVASHAARTAQNTPQVGHVPTQKKLSLQHVAHTTRRCTMSPCTDLSRRQKQTDRHKAP